MAEYIERSDAVQCARDLANDFRNDGFAEEAGAADTVGDWLQDFPAAADVRPVVYCKECRHRDPEDHKCDSGERERQGCPFKVADDYFCAFGEK